MTKNPLQFTSKLCNLFSFLGESESDHEEHFTGPIKRKKTIKWVCLIANEESFCYLYLYETIELGLFFIQLSASPYGKTQRTRWTATEIMAVKKAFGPYLNDTGKLHGATELKRAISLFKGLQSRPIAEIKSWLNNQQKRLLLRRTAFRILWSHKSSPMIFGFLFYFFEFCF